MGGTVPKSGGADMRADKARRSEIASWTLLVLCALSAACLVVRREFIQSSMAMAAATEPQAIYIDGWEDALATGLRSGSANAPVQVVEFADFECPWCARFEATVRAIRGKYPDQVAFTFAYYPLPQHSFAATAAHAAECAHTQGRFEAMRSRLFEKQQAFGSLPWIEFATEAGIPDLRQFETCMTDTQTFERVEHGKKLAEKLGVRATPTIIVNGWKFSMPPTLDQFDEIVKNVVDGRPPAAGS
jgi:protein-disulfide isomerase